MFSHIPVLLQEVIRELKIDSGRPYIDATLGGGGHTKGILDKGGIVLGIDQDEDAIGYVEESLGANIQETQLKVVRGNFNNIQEIAVQNGFGKVWGILFDLGVSSYQMDSSKRGFSIKSSEKLDMRMDKQGQLTAEMVINTYSTEALADIFMRFGEEDKGLQIARAIGEVRKIKRIEATAQLVEIIEKIIQRFGKIHPATKVFQALRIEVNQELDALKAGLIGALPILENGGRILVISFHSLEDRIIKRTFDDWEYKKLGTVINKKPITAKLHEVRSNPRARSAKLRIFEKSI